MEPNTGMGLGMGFSMFALTMIGLLIALLPVLTTVWAFFDTENRGRSGCLASLRLVGPSGQAAPGTSAFAESRLRQQG